MDGLTYLRSIIRDDNERLDLDAKEIYLAEENNLFKRPSVGSTDLEYTDTSGGEMIAQRLTTYAQEFTIIITPRTTDIWTLINKVESFLTINHTYKIVTVRNNGKDMARRTAWRASGESLQWEISPQANYATATVGFTIGDTNTYEYAEDADGNETYANIVTLPLVTASAVGELWDEVGKVWDGVGAVWESGSGGIQTVQVNSSTKIYPTWTVNGPCVNPSLANNTTDTSAQYNGTIATGQTLVVDMTEGKAYLNGALVSRNLSGQVSFNPGENQISFDSDGGLTSESTIGWNNIIG